jgi:hypothetical protein
VERTMMCLQRIPDSKNVKNLRSYVYISWFLNIRSAKR